ncbi:MAG: hypothetical protein HKN31_09230, partial [Pricia sp.]|nr:hypothetical protein [Pricia sp.]
MSYKTPGVYVEEISLLPPSVAQVETAIPAFIGYTEKAEDLNGKSLFRIPTRVKSLLEYETFFGASHMQSLLVTLADEAPFAPQSVSFNGSESPYRIYQSLQLYFANGGGPCFIISTGGFTESPGPSLNNVDDYDELKAGLDAARKIDEITLLLFPEADRLNANQFYDLYKDVLSQCADLKDRFGLFDILPTDTDGQSFRDNIGVNNLSYGAAYYPYLNTKIVHPHSTETVTFEHGASNAFDDKTWAALMVVSTALSHQAQVVSAKTQADAAVVAAATLTKEGKLVQYKIALGAAEKALKNAEDANALVVDETFDSTELTTAKNELDAVKAQNISSSSTNPEIDTAIVDLATSSATSETAITGILAQINTDQGIAASHNTTISTYFTNSFVADI